MKKRYKRGLLLSTLTTASLLFVATQGFTYTHGVTLKKWTNGVDATGGVSDVGRYDAYSPRATCGGTGTSTCHTEKLNENVDTAALRTGGRGSYHGGGATKDVVKTQGVENQASGEVEWLSYNVKAYKHGFVVGRHSQEGRNEDYGHHMRVAKGGRYWESSPGMFGKY